MLTISPIYAGLLALLTLVLSVRVSQARRKYQVSMGDGDEKAIFKAIRVHANSIEYIPIGVILLVLLELQSAPGWSVHTLGLILLVGRVLHAYGLGSQPQVPPARVYGAYMTLISTAVMAVGNIALAVF